MKRTMLPVAVFFLIFACWEICSDLNDDLLFVLPAPSSILLCIWERADRFLFHTAVTFKEMAGGFALAFLVAFPLAWIMSLWKTSRRVLQPIFIVIQCVPMFALAPIMVIWFGWSYAAIAIPTALMIFFPLTMNIYHGLRATPRHLIEFFRIHEATRWQMFLKLQLPWSLPHIFAGIRVSAAIAGIGAVAGEWAGAEAGLGLLMIESRRSADLEMTFGALFCLTILSLMLYSAAIFVERRVTSRRTLRLRLEGISTKCLVFFLGIALWSCQQSDTNRRQVHLSLDWLPNPNHVPLYVGIEKGIFQDHGIDLKIKKIWDPGDTIPYLVSGQSDLSVSYMPYTIRAIAHGAEIEPIGILIKEPLNALIFRKGLGVKEPIDLDGKILGYCIDGNSTRFLDTVLRLNSINPRAKRNVSFDLVSTLGSAKVDVIYGGYWNIECEHLRSLGVDTGYFKLKEFGVPNYYELIIIAKCNSAQTSPEFVSAFQNALQESIKFSIEHPEEAFSMYVRANPDKRKKTGSWERIAWQNTLPALADVQHVNQMVWNDFSRWLRKHDLMR